MYLSSLSVKNSLSIHGSVSSKLETDGNDLVPGDENMVDDAFLQIAYDLMSRFIVMQNKGYRYLSQLSLALFFNCEI